MTLKSPKIILMAGITRSSVMYRAISKKSPVGYQRRHQNNSGYYLLKTPTVNKNRYSCRAATFPVQRSILTLLSRSAS